MGSDKPKSAIRFCRVLPRFIWCQLNYPATAFSALIDSPFDHFLAKTNTACFRRYANTFDLAAPCPLSGHSGNEGELKAANYGTFNLEDYENLIGIIVDGLKGVNLIWMQGWAHVRVALTENIISKQADDGRQIVNQCRTGWDSRHLFPIFCWLVFIFI